MLKINNRDFERAYALINAYAKTYIRFEPKSYVSDLGLFDNLLLMVIEDSKNEITLIFEEISDIDNLINKLSNIKNKLKEEEIELGINQPE